jgi:hypothetical protein
MTEDAVIAAWYSSFEYARREATNGRLALLRGEDWSSYDARGLHVLSTAYGEMQALAALAPDVLGDDLLRISVGDLRRACRQAAADEYDAERYSDWRMRFLLARAEPEAVLA